ncbi:MAG: DNA (cytosine-5-)-methyltransferase [Henriciella sp.]|jgi:DNA (cytosine-5)-methyltransferase 1|uniref:DNA cytosine methyltransferase n=1 Tax=uncultured Henriciella sp. TaxID=1608424 RepID=UPI000C4FB5B4|nr:DNA cytosine methyltransferase [Henriciella sp.]MAN75406.1 DNA (cytosine-5-)-methyltransferase [Henriciella sp.]MBF34897.1 DNA (cytosine-5-)-methyltransferase [Hyphomonadaceae bacterium]MBK76802.1 DNA (cytosine-5-)-methyltransferase [Henriciella sp.]MBL4805598.1 DNA cytosine methyltransferase [Alphaproteobacteria bacterium]
MLTKPHDRGESVNNPRFAQERILVEDKPSIVDLFSGCGGFGLGAEWAGFETIVAVDKDPDLQSSYSLNFPRARAVVSDVNELDDAFWRKILRGKRPAGVIGGPPCQGFSTIGKRAPDDIRNTLLASFFKQVSIIQPDFFVMENVAGILDPKFSEMLQSSMSSIIDDYRILQPITISAEKFGAPTKRKRVLVIGARNDSAIDLKPSDFVPKQTSLVTIADAISDLPSPSKQSQRGQFDWGEYTCAVEEASTYAQLMRQAPNEHLGWKEAVAKLLNNQTSGNLATEHSPAVVDRFRNTPPGKTESVSRYPRLSSNGQCPTLRAGTGADRGSYQSMRPLHPVEPRVISVREAARLQSFPDWFVFHPTKWHSFRMIGNSVPPLVSKSILSKIKTRIESKQLHHRVLAAE